MGSPSKCPVCKSKEVQSAGSYEQRGKTKARYWVCYDCGHSWTTR